MKVLLIIPAYNEESGRGSVRHVFCRRAVKTDDALICVVSARGFGELTPQLVESLRAADVREADFTPWCDDILILHGTKDEIVPIAGVEAFAEKNRIPFFPIENADHRFIDAGKMREAIVLIADFLED